MLTWAGLRQFVRSTLLQFDGQVRNTNIAASLQQL